MTYRILVSRFPGRQRIILLKTTYLSSWIKAVYLELLGQGYIKNGLRFYKYYGQKMNNLLKKMNKEFVYTICFGTAVMAIAQSGIDKTGITKYVY